MILKLQLQLAGKSQKRQIEYPRFNGTPGTDGEEWLKLYNRAAVFNTEDDEQKLLRVPFCLASDALQWFERRVPTWTTWKQFEIDFQDRFVDASARRQQARRKLDALRRTASEKMIPHLEYVLHLCRDIDPAMAEELIIDRCLMTLRREDIQSLAAVKPKTLAELRAHLSWLDKTLPNTTLERERAADPAINLIARPMNGSSESLNFFRSRSSSREKQTLLPRSRSNSRERRPLQPIQPRHRSPTRRQMFQPSPSPAPASKYPAPAPVYQAPTQHAPAQSQRNNFAGNSETAVCLYNNEDTGWFEGNRRLPDGRAICNYCNNVGHTIRYCRNRKEGRPRARPDQPSGNAAGR